jgi:hypothetical protein
VDPRGAPSSSSGASLDEANRRTLARKHYQEGQRLFEKRKFREAIETLRKAAELWPRREIFFNIGLCHFELGERMEAAQAIRMSLEGAGPKEREALPKPLRALLSQVGVVTVRVSRKDAEIWLDGRLRGRGTLVTVVQPGDVAAEIRISGVVRSRKVLQVGAGVEVQWELGPLGQELDADKGQRKELDGKPRHESGWRRTRLSWVWLAGVGAGALVATGVAIGLGARTRSLHQDYLETPSWSLRDEGRSTQAATNVFWGLAGAAAVSAAVLAVFTRFGRERPKGAAWTPIVTPGGAGIEARFQGF